MSNLSIETPLITSAQTNSEVAEWVNLNAVMQGVLQELTAGCKAPKTVVRCETLPMIKAGRQQIERLFHSLVQMIAARPPKARSLFLYILCEEDKLYRPVAEEGIKRYCIHFRTNALAGKEWRQGNEKNLQECTFIIARLGGDFAINETKNTGCIFSISLLGKL